MSEEQTTLGPPEVEDFAIPQAAEFPCQCYGVSLLVPTPTSCLCPKTERMLRAYAQADPGSLPALTPEQREWCYQQLDRVEGYGRDGFMDNADEWLAKTVLNAWADYARDKGVY